MNTLAQTQVPVYHLERDPQHSSIPNFRMYHFNGERPHRADLLTPHRKDHYLFVFINRGGSRQWVDTTLYTTKEQTIYFTGPENIIVKEATECLFSTGFAFTPDFLSLQENTALAKLPVVQNPHNIHGLELTPADIAFVEDMLDKITAEYRQPDEWQQRMLTAHVTVLLTYLSRLYVAQAGTAEASADKALLKRFQAAVNENFREHKEVSDYAALLHISAGHLSEVVKMQSGKPAIKHIHERLVLEARRLLFHTDESLKEIAYSLGFADASYFNRFFKRETGETPAAYRDNIRKMYQ